MREGLFFLGCRFSRLAFLRLNLQGAELLCYRDNTVCLLIGSSSLGFFLARPAGAKAGTCIQAPPLGRAGKVHLETWARAALERLKVKCPWNRITVRYILPRPKKKSLVLMFLHIPHRQKPKKGERHHFASNCFILTLAY